MLETFPPGVYSIFDKGFIDKEMMAVEQKLTCTKQYLHNYGNIIYLKSFYLLGIMYKI